MKYLLQKLGILTWWCLWPVLWVYFRNSHRTRVLLVDENKVLVTKGWLSNGRWALPGGGLHKGENPAVGAARELLEETGLALEPEALRFHSMNEFRDEGLHFRYSLFIVPTIVPVPLKAQLREIAEIAWVDYSELNSSNSNNDVMHAVQAWFV
jgi:8-oxo-dGTP pyrophosphatase MutT (NUDIX family)